MKPIFLTLSLLIFSLSARAAEVSELVAILSGEDYEARMEARNELSDAVAQLNAPGADATARATLVNQLLEHAGPETPFPARQWVLRRLGLIAGEESVEPLAGMLGDEDERIRDLARKTLSRIGTPGALNALAGGMNEPQNTRDLLGYLSAFSRQGAVAQPVAGAIGQHLAGEPEVAEAAAIALGKIGGEQARQLLLSALGSASPELAPVLQENLLVTGIDPASAQALVEGGANPAVRAGAYRVLLESDPVRAKSLLSAILDDPEFSGRDAILRLAVTAGSGEMAAELLENLDELREQDQPIILGGISDSGRAEFEPRMAQLYQTSENAAVKSVALECLSAIASKDSLPLLLEVYETQGGRSQELAAQAISTVEAPEFDQQLLQEAAAGEPARRARAIRLLGLRNPAGTTELINTILAGQAEDEVLRAALEITQIVANLDTLRVLIDLVHANQDSSLPQKDVLLQLKRATLRAASPAEAWNAVFEPALQNASSDEARRSLIMILDCAASEETLDYLKNTAASDNALLRQAAVRNLMRWQEFRLGPVAIDLAANPALSEAESKMMWQKAQQVLTSRDIERPNFQNELDFAITLLQSSAPLEVKEQVIEHYQEGIGKPREKRQFKEQMTEAELPSEVRQRITPLLESIKS